jgi:hypothetical protein
MMDASLISEPYVTKWRISQEVCSADLLTGYCHSKCAEQDLATVITYRLGGDQFSELPASCFSRRVRPERNLCIGRDNADGIDLRVFKLCWNAK